jgi:hypothetical protein
MAEICVPRGTLRDLANRWFQPLTHVSGGGFPRVSATYVNAESARTREQRFAVAQSAAHSVLARFVEQGGDATIAQSIRLNWCPSWGADPGRPDHVLLNWTGLTQADLDRGRERATSALASAIEARKRTDPEDPGHFELCPVMNDDLTRSWQVLRDGEPISGLFDEKGDAEAAMRAVSQEGLGGNLEGLVTRLRDLAEHNRRHFPSTAEPGYYALGDEAADAIIKLAAPKARAPADAEKLAFDLLEGLKRAYREAGDEAKAMQIATAFSRATGGIDVEFLIGQLGPAPKPDAPSTAADAEDDAEWLRKERDALLQRPIDLAKMDSIDEDATDRMITYYWWQQAQEAREELSRLSPVTSPDTPEKE